MLLDILFCITGFFFLIRGFFRGFIRESFAIISLLLAYFLAYHYGHFFTPWIAALGFAKVHASAVSHTLFFFLLLWPLRILSSGAIQHLPRLPVWLRFPGLALGAGMAAVKTLLIFCILLAGLHTYPSHAAVRMPEDGSRTALYLKNTAQALPLLASGNISETGEVLYDQLRYYQRFLFTESGNNEQFSRGSIF